MNVELIVGLLASAVPLLLVGYLLLRGIPAVFRLFMALIVVGLGYLTATGAIGDIGKLVLGKAQELAPADAAAPPAAETAPAAAETTPAPAAAEPAPAPEEAAGEPPPAPEQPDTGAAPPPAEGEMPPAAETPPPTESAPAPAPAP